MRYRKKPVEVDAMQWTGDNMMALCRWSESFGGSLRWRFETGSRLFIDTLEGSMRADKGDWIIRGIVGEYYPCKPAIFAATYEAAP